MRSIFLHRRQTGLTLIELMVALTLAMMVVLAAIATLMVSKQGFSSIDNATELRDNARFAHEMVRRIAMQAGFQSLATAASTRQDAIDFGLGPTEPDVYGLNNALVPAGEHVNPLTAQDGSRNNCSAANTACANGSDVLAVRYQGMNTQDMTGGAGSIHPDGTIINCNTYNTYCSLGLQEFNLMLADLSPNYVIKKWLLKMTHFSIFFWYILKLEKNCLCLQLCTGHYKAEHLLCSFITRLLKDDEVKVVVDVHHQRGREPG